MNNDHKIKKNILSESNLLKLFMCDPQFNISQIPNFDTYFLSALDLEQLLISWKKNIERDSTLLCRQSLSLLTDLPQDSLYSNLEYHNWYLAAQVAEVFRNPSICKNAGRLNLKQLQKNICKWLIHADQGLSLVIAWGQPKRSAGGIKCMGPYADLAELFSISRLITITRAIEKIVKCRINLTVLTGGHRFYPALFTRSKLTTDYDAQRQAIADFMDDDKRIKFLPFIRHNEILNYSIDESQLKQISHQQILSLLNTITLNIDWEHLLHPQISCRYHNPHHIELTQSLANWLSKQSIETLNQYIRQSIYYLLTNKNTQRLNADSETDEDSIQLKNLIIFMHKVAWESTKKYIVIQEMNYLKQREALGDQYFRLSVHEKDDLNNQPAILTLGVNGGNQLSQHVIAFLKNRVLHFGAFSEFWDSKPVLIKLNSDCDYQLFNWLKQSEQALCISNMPNEELLPFLNMSSRLVN